MLLRFIGREASCALVLGALVLWAPLPAGSVTPAGQLAFRLAACGIFLAAVAVRAWPARRTLLPAVAMAAIAALGFVQSCPWPAAVAAVASPEHLRLAGQAAEILEADRPAFVPLSLNAATTRSAALSWLAVAALLAATLVAGRRAVHRRWLLTALAAAALAQLGVGLVRLETASAGGLAEVVLRPEGRLRGTFANPNHLSLLFEIAMAAVAAWVWVELRRWRSPAGGRARPALLLAVWSALLVGVVLTGSRAGLAAAVLGTIAQVAAVLLAGGRRRAAAGVALALLLGLGGLAVAGSQLGIQRYETVSLFESNLRSRVLVTGPALELWRRFPLTGTGLGTFEDAFPMTAPAELAPVLWNRAHNDPLELLVTGGVLGLALGLVGLVAALPPIWRGLRRVGEVEERAAAVAAAGALAAAGVHELFDFGLVIPANALALAVVVGSALAAGRPPTPAVRGSDGRGRG